MDLSKASALITGASRGLGLALAEELGRRGARLALVARDPTRLHAEVERLRGAGITAHPLVADVGDKDAIYSIAGQAQALIGPIDLVVHNASTLGATPLTGLIDTECETFQHVLEVNLLAPFRLTKALVGSMLVRRGGLIVHLSSDAAVSAYANWGAYGVSKAALDQLARSWAVELAGSGVRILSIDPGEMDTDMHRAAMPEADPSLLGRPGQVAAIMADIFADPARHPALRVIAQEVRS